MVFIIIFFCACFWMVNGDDFIWAPTTFYYWLLFGKGPA